MSTFLWILLLVLFSLPSLLGKKDKRGNAKRKTVVSGENAPDSTVYTDTADALEEIKRQVFGQGYVPQQETQAPRQEQFLYNEYNPAEMQEETKQPKSSPVFVQPEPVVEQGSDYSFDLRQAVIQSVILENPYVN
jgi:hypothetical protein